MKSILTICLFFSALASFGQGKAMDKKIDSLKALVENANDDTIKVILLARLSYYEQFTHIEDGLMDGNRALKLSTKLNWTYGIGVSYEQIAYRNQGLGRYEDAIKYHKKAIEEYKKLKKCKLQAADEYNAIALVYQKIDKFDLTIQYANKALDIFRERKNEQGRAAGLNTLANVYMQKFDYAKALEFYLDGLQIFEKLDDKSGIAMSSLNIGHIYLTTNDTNKALVFFQKSLQISIQINQLDFVSLNAFNLANLYESKKEYNKAASYAHMGIKTSKLMLDTCLQTLSMSILAGIFTSEEKFDSAYFYLNNALKQAGENKPGMDYVALYSNTGNFYLSLAEKSNEKEIFRVIGSDKKEALKLSEKYFMKYLAFKNSKAVGAYFESLFSLSKVKELQGNNKEALYFYKQAVHLKDSLKNESSEKKLAILKQKREDDVHKKEMEFHALQLEKAKNEKWYFITGMGMLAGLVLVIFNRFRLKKKSNEKLVKAYNDLKQTQAQMLQQEKMASLGQLTGGIAHEINNPMNFISGSIAPLRRNFDDFVQLLSAVETMELPIEFSRQISAKKSEMDMEYTIQETAELLQTIENGAARTSDIVRSLRSFSQLDNNSLKPAQLEDGLEATLNLLENRMAGRIEVVRHYAPLPEVLCFPGDINQVFMSVLSNAIEAITAEGIIMVKSFIEGGFVKISIKDSGVGIPNEIQAHIFDPFYTTKEVGQGTGMGLSIAFSILEKHKGSIVVNSATGQGAEFIISLPVNG